MAHHTLQEHVAPGSTPTSVRMVPNMPHVHGLLFPLQESNAMVDPLTAFQNAPISSTLLPVQFVFSWSRVSVLGSAFNKKSIPSCNSVLVNLGFTL